MPKQTHCLKHKSRLELDGVCHECILEKSKQTAKQFSAFGKMLTKKSSRIKGKKKKRKKK